MLESLNLSREKLAEWGIQSHPMNMVLYAMLEDAYTYEGAVQQYAEYRQCDPATVERMVNEAVEKAVDNGTLRPSGRMVIEACYAAATQRGLSL